VSQSTRANHTVSHTLLNINCFARLSCVVAAPYSDWSISPLAKRIGSKEEEAKLYIQFTRTKADIFVHYALSSSITETPPKELQLLREIKGFAAARAEEAKSSLQGSDYSWHLGVMVCGPLSESTEATWDNFSLEMK
jgi:regulation of enolase protein 1 (concanavalin A-like superfamily)